MPTLKQAEIPTTPIHPITKEYEECHAELIALQQKMYNLYSKSMNEVAKNALPLADTVDIGYFNKKSIDICKDMIKFFRYRNELCNKWVCMQDIKAGLNNMSAEKRFIGHYSVAYSRIKQAANVPTKGTVEHAQLMRWLGIDPTLWTSMNINFNDLCDIITKRAMVGLPPPDGIGKAFPVFGAMYKRIKLVNEEAFEEEEEENDDGEGSGGQVK